MGHRSAGARVRGLLSWRRDWVPLLAARHHGFGLAGAGAGFGLLEADGLGAHSPVAQLTHRIMLPTSNCQVLAQSSQACCRWRVCERVDVAPIRHAMRPKEPAQWCSPGLPVMEGGGCKVWVTRPDC